MNRPKPWWRFYKAVNGLQWAHFSPPWQGGESDQTERFPDPFRRSYQRRRGVSMRVLTLFTLFVVFAFPPQVGAQATKPCNPEGNVQFICGQDAPEDLVLLPESEWVVASVYSQNG